MTNDKTLPTICIWCGKTKFKPSLEHILPDSLGCPPNFVLRDCVCVSCNNSLGHLDHALLRQFEIPAFMLGIPRKGGKPPSINNWAALGGKRGPNGPELYLNAGPGKIDALGRKLNPANRSNGILNPTIERTGPFGQVSFQQEFGNDPKFIRALYKVGLSATAYWHGSNYMREPTFEAARTFVRTGKGDFKSIILGYEQDNGHHFSPPWSNADKSELVLGMTILGVSFIVDFGVNQTAIARIVAELERQGTLSWTVLPIA